MKLTSVPSLAMAAFGTAAFIVLTACGGNQPPQPAATPNAATPGPSATPTEATTPPPGDNTARVAPPTSEPQQPVQPVAAPKPKSRPKPESEPPASRPPEAAPTPTPAPTPEPVVKILPSGTDLDAELIEGASSKTSQVGSALRARVINAVVVDGLTVVPEGSIVLGTVTEAVPLKKIGGAASLGLRFDTLELKSGAKVAISAGIHEQGKSETGKDAGTIAGATAGGALLGRLFSKNDKTKGTLIGAVVGAAAGTGAAAATKGREVELPPGTKLALHLETPVSITVQP